MTELALSVSDNHQFIWNNIVGLLKEELPKQTFITWFAPLKSLSFENNTLTVGVGCNFNLEWLESHYRDLLNRSACAVIGSGGKIELQICENNQEKSTSKTVQKRRRKDDNLPAITITTSEQTKMKSQLNSNYRFDNFIEGDSNRVARAAAYSIISSLDNKPVYNPLLIHGGSGLGKTHLIQAIGNAIVDSNIDKRFLYVTSEEFTAEFVRAIQSGKVDAFNKLYRSVDVLLIDDVQFFMTRDKTQEAFFHTFNTLYNNGKQLVFSSDRPTSELNKFDKRLLSRLQWGLTIEIQPPELETRMAILKSIAESRNIVLSDEIISIIAENVTDNVRMLQGALTSLFAHQSLLEMPITIDMAREVMNKINIRVSNNIGVETILELTARYLDVKSDMIRSKNRKREIAEARMIAMYLSTELTNSTLKNIGLKFGGRDHSTVLHAKNKIIELINNDDEFKKSIDNIREQIERFNV